MYKTTHQIIIAGPFMIHLLGIAILLLGFFIQTLSRETIPALMAIGWRIFSPGRILVLRFLLM